MPFAVFKQTCVMPYWENINALPKTVSWWGQKCGVLLRDAAIENISIKTSLLLDDLKLMSPEYFLNDKKQVSNTYTDRDNACLVLDLELKPHAGKYSRYIGEGPYVVMFPRYTVEKIP